MQPSYFVAIQITVNKSWLEGQVESGTFDIIYYISKWAYIEQDIKAYSITKFFCLDAPFKVFK